ncbi:MAG: DUF2971 domain-containing protein [Gammaproteobacteria bacterium]|nr:DUF2971 domain-containing protein [Gammaproteobacteria bacterium]
MPDDNDEILYHYCSIEAFHSIIENKSIWLSLASQSNDSMEGKMLSCMLENKLKKLPPVDMESSSKYDKKLVSEIKSISQAKEVVCFFEEMQYGLIFSLSEEKDLLSQWRAYTNDGTGISIGFSKKRLQEELKKHNEESNLEEKIEAKLSRAHYEDPYDDETIDSYVSKLKNLSDENPIIEYMKQNYYILKNSSFSEEKEWRILATVKAHHLNQCKKEVLFRTRNQQLTPYITMKLHNPENLIKKIVLGPKNKTPIRIIEHLLIREGFLKTHEVEENSLVTFSKAPYQ